MKQHEIKFELHNHPTLGTGTLSGGFTTNLNGHGDGIAFSYLNGMPKKIFLSCDKNPAIKTIFDEMSAAQAKTTELVRSLKNLKKPAAQFGWCDKCENYCYGDCQAQA